VSKYPNKNFGVWVHALNFGSVQKNVDVRVRTLNFGAARKNVGVQVHALNLSLHGVHTHNKVRAMCTHIIMAHVVCVVLVEHRGILLVRPQYGYMLSRDSLVNGTCIVLVHSGGVLKFGME
jgi:hypothetical protein